MNARQQLRTLALLGLGAILGGGLVVAWGDRGQAGAAQASAQMVASSQAGPARSAAVRGWEKG